MTNNHIYLQILWWKAKPVQFIVTRLSLCLKNGNTMAISCFLVTFCAFGQKESSCNKRKFGFNWMANSLFMVESPPLLDPHSEAKTMTWSFLEPQLASCSWSGNILDAIKNQVNQKWHIQPMRPKSKDVLKHWRSPKEWWNRNQLLVLVISITGIYIVMEKTKIVNIGFLGVKTIQITIKSRQTSWTINYSSYYLSKHKHTQCKVHSIDCKTSLSQQFPKSYANFTKEMECNQNFTAS